MKNLLKMDKILEILKDYEFELGAEKPNFIIYTDTIRFSDSEGEKSKILVINAKKESKSVKYQALEEILELFNDDEAKDTRDFINKFKSPLLSKFSGKLSNNLNIKIT